MRQKTSTKAESDADKAGKHNPEAICWDVAVGRCKQLNHEWDLIAYINFIFSGAARILDRWGNTLGGWHRGVPEVEPQDAREIS